jgi:lipopolysaccharide export system protein LptC
LPVYQAEAMTDFTEAPPQPRRVRFDPTRGRGNDANVYKRAFRHSQRVRWLKFALPVIAVVAVASFVYVMRFASSEGGAVISLSGVNVEEKSLVMKQPHISGFEGTRRAYEVKAVRAVQDLNNPKVVTLEKIDASFGMGGDVTAAMVATTGVFDTGGNMLTLKDGITLKTSDGTQARLADARIDVKNGGLVSRSPVEISMTEGTIRANAVEIKDRGRRILFSNGVSVSFIPPDDEAAGAGEAPTRNFSEAFGDTAGKSAPQ